ncbi:hypothetical protein CsatB_020568 [Cannabis sativa]
MSSPNENLPQKEETEWSLPSHVIPEILLKLPVRSLMRFKTVSKEWNLNICNPKFVPKHYENQLRITPQKKIFRCYNNTTNKVLYYIHGGGSIKSENFTPLPNDEKFSQTERTTYLRKVGSHNGILCFYYPTYDHKSKLILWNPSLQESRCIDIGPKDRKIHMLGFGYDSGTKDYKAVNFRYSHDSPLFVDLYSLRKEKWRYNNSPNNYSLLPYKLVKFVWRSLNLEGGNKIHWLVFFEDNNRDVFRSILFFDVRENSVGLIALPESLAVVADDSDVSLAYCVDDRDGLLTLFEYKNDGLMSFCCNVWMLKTDSIDYTWTKLEFSINLDRKFKALGFLSKYIILVISGDKKILFDTRTQHKHFIQIGDGDIWILSYVGTYMENIITLPKYDKKTNPN